MRRALAAEFIGALLLTAAVVGSGIMGERLAGGNAAVALLANTGATVAALATLIAVFGPISGAHFNPVVTLVAFRQRQIALPRAVAYIGAQIAGCCAGAMLANLMFELPAIHASTHARTGAAQWLSEVVATAGLVFIAFSSLNFRRRMARSRLDRRRLLVHRFHLVREPGDHHRPLTHRHLRRHPARRRAGIHRGAARRRRRGRDALAVARGTTGARMTDAIARAARFNRECECMGTDVPALQQRLDARLNDAGSPGSVAETHPHLFSETPVFLARAHAQQLQRVIAAIGAVAALPAYREEVLARAPAIARPAPANPGVFFGFDFHIAATARNSSRSTPMPAARC